MLTKTGGAILLAHNPPKWGNFACRFTPVYSAADLDAIGFAASRCDPFGNVGFVEIDHLCGFLASFCCGSGRAWLILFLCCCRYMVLHGRSRKPKRLRGVLSALACGTLCGDRGKHVLCAVVDSGHAKRSLLRCCEEEFGSPPPQKKCRGLIADFPGSVGDQGGRIPGVVECREGAVSCRLECATR